MSVPASLRDALAADRRALVALGPVRHTGPGPDIGPERDTGPGPDPGPGWLHPGLAALAIHRVAHGLQRRGWGRAAGLLAFANLLLTRAEFATTAAIAPGVAVVDPSGIVVDGALGPGCVINAQVVVGPACTDDLARRGLDVGGGPGSPVLGAGVVLGVGAMVLGPVLVGDGASIGPRCVVREDVGPGAKLAPPRPRRVASFARP